MLLMHCKRRPCSRALFKAGKSRAKSMAMIVTITSSASWVNPEPSRRCTPAYCNFRHARPCESAGLHRRLESRSIRLLGAYPTDSHIARRPFALVRGNQVGVQRRRVRVHVVVRGRRVAVERRHAGLGRSLPVGGHQRGVNVIRHRLIDERHVPIAEGEHSAIGMIARRAGVDVVIRQDLQYRCRSRRASARGSECY